MIRATLCSIELDRIAMKSLVNHSLRQIVAVMYIHFTMKQGNGRVEQKLSTLRSLSLSCRFFSQDIVVRSSIDVVGVSVEGEWVE